MSREEREKGKKKKKRGSVFVLIKGVGKEEKIQSMRGWKSFPTTSNEMREGEKKGRGSVSFSSPDLGPGRGEKKREGEGAVTITGH